MIILHPLAEVVVDNGGEGVGVAELRPDGPVVVGHVVLQDAVAPAHEDEGVLKGDHGRLGKFKKKESDKGGL